MKIVIAILIFSAIILFHELGHFLLAKKNGIEVIEFSLGMGPRILSRKLGETKYSLKLLPLGGSCLMAGEDEDDDRPGTFNSASVWGRFAVIAAGPVFNFILAFVMALIIVASIGYTPAYVDTVEEGSSAAQAGLKAGDQITEYEGYHIDIAKDLNIYLGVMGLPQDSVEMMVKRDGRKISLKFEPESTEVYQLGFSRSTEGGDLPLEVLAITAGMPMESTGIEAGDVITAINGSRIATGDDYDRYITENPLSDKQPIEITYTHKGESYTTSLVPKASRSVSLGFIPGYLREKGNLWQTLKYSALEVKFWIRTTVLSLKELISGHFGMKDLSGPVGVVNAIGDTYETSREEGAFWVWMNMLNMAILLSANLGVMNLLPIPALDGGRLVFILLEAIRGKPVNRTVEGYVHLAGFMLLMLLMIVVMYNDILKLF